MYSKAFKKGDWRIREALGKLALGGNTVACEWIKTFAEEEYEEAQFILGLMYEKGIGVGRSDDQAAHWYIKAFKKIGDWQSSEAFKKLVIKGNKVAFKWIKPLAEEGDTEAQFLLGQRYEEKRGGNPSDDEAARWYSNAFKKGDRQIREALGKLAHRGNTVACECIKTFAEEEYEEAQFILGLMYEKGIGVGRSDDQAAHWYIKAFNNGYWQIREALGKLALKGNKVAFGWVETCAKEGSTEAQFILGLMYEKGIGVGRSDDQAIEWYIKAFEKRHYQASKALKRFDLKENKVPCEGIKTYEEKKDREAQAKPQRLFQDHPKQDLLEPSTLLQIASEPYTEGRKEYQIIKMIENEGIYFIALGDYSQAKKAFKEAANQGSYSAQLMLAKLYYRGLGASQDSDKAKKWYEKGVAACKYPKELEDFNTCNKDLASLF